MCTSVYSCVTNKLASKDTRLPFVAPMSSESAVVGTTDDDDDDDDADDDDDDDDAGDEAEESSDVDDNDREDATVLIGPSDPAMVAPPPTADTP